MCGIYKNDDITIVVHNACYSVVTIKNNSSKMMSVLI